MNHSKQQLEQLLLELHYGLLDESEEHRLRHLIETDATVASLWAKTLGMAGQFADAAKLVGVPEVEQVHFEADASEMKRLSVLDPTPRNSRSNLVGKKHTQSEINNYPAPPVKTKSTSDFSRPVSKSEFTNSHYQRNRRNYGRFLKALTALAAMLFLAVSAGFWFSAPSSPANAILIDVQSADDGDLPNSFNFVTSQMLSQAGSLREVSASLMVSIHAGGAVLHSENLKTNAFGKLSYSVPAELRLPKNAMLHVISNERDVPEKTLFVPLEPTRCITHLSIDKPVYRPGETIHFRSLSLERYSLKPNIDLPIRFEMLDPSGAAVTGASLEGVTDRGVGNGEFKIPAGAPGGEFTLVVKSLDGFFPDEKRTVQVRNYRVPRFKKDLEFKRRSYGPGDTVEADFEAIRAEGGALANQPIKITATLDGEVVHESSSTTNVTGNCSISFKLPALISKGGGQLSVAIDDGGTQEVQSKTIPIQLGKVAVDFYPEGGYLVGGLSNRVYFSARNPLGEPIHIAGEIQDRSGKRVAKLETVRDGMGRFEFAPKPGERYSLKVTEPVDVINSPRLPKVVSGLPVLSTGDGVFTSDESIKFEIQSSQTRDIVVQAACRGKLVANQSLQLQPGKSTLEIELPQAVEGAIRLTILDAGKQSVTQQGRIQIGSPLVERLVYRESQRKLTVKLDETASSLERSPGEPVRVSLAVFDENGKPTPAVLGVAVVDDAALSLEENERPEMPTHFLLTSEIQKPEDLEHANFYLSGSDESRESLDLLLGTQGWRRFVNSGASLLTDSESVLPTEGFNEQLARLIELDGKSSEQVRLGNVEMVNQDWRSYSSEVSFHWRRYRATLTFWMAPLLLLMLIIYLMRPKLNLATSAGLLLVVSACMAGISGCGQAAPHGDVAFEKVATEAPAFSAKKQQEAPPMADAFFDDDINAEFGDEVPDMNAMFGGGRIPGERPATAKFVPKPSKNVRIVHHDPTDEARFVDSLSSDGESEPGFESKTMSGIPQTKLQQLLQARGLNSNDLAGQLLDELRFPVREYAHQHVSTKPNVREDFSETLCWQPLLITDSQGKASIRFDLSDSVTTFKVIADVHSSDGRLGTGGGELVSRIPLQIEPKMPLAVTDGDRIDLPVALINATNSELPVELSIKAGEAFEIVGPSSLEKNLTKQERTRGYFGLNVVGGSSGPSGSMIELTGTSDSLSDSVRKPIEVTPSGYPIRESVSGVLNEKVSVMLPIPSDASSGSLIPGSLIPGSLQVTLKAYPSPLADLLAGVESILREPHGCFEQTSATNYPNTMALQYLETNRLANPRTTRRAKSLLEKGYSKLVSFECDKLGYEWFGSDPGHEALSAFGLLQFNDMARVMKVDLEMVARTRSWLLDRRNGKGGFKRNTRHLHVWSVKQQIVDAYVLWALTESDLAAGNPQRSATELLTELNQLNKVARESNDPYLIGLAAASMLNVDRNADGILLLDKLVDLQKDSGELNGATTVTQSGGISKNVETTAIAILAWSKRSAEYSSATKAAAQWLTKNRRGNGGFGSTQATVLALKALVAYSENAPAAGSGSILFVKQKGKVIGQVRLPEDAKNGSVVELTGLGDAIDPSDSTLEIFADGIERLPFSIEVLYHSAKPPSDDRCPLELTTEFQDVDKGIVEAGKVIRVKSVLQNKTDQGQPMTVATIGLPGGVEPRVEQLNELREAGTVDFYEIRPREVICYWRTIKPSETKTIEFDVTAEIPGKYTGPASRAYLYYTAEQKVWTKPLSIEIGR